MLVPLGRAPTWRFHTKLYKFGWNTFPNNARMKNCTELNLDKLFYVWLIYHIQDSWLNSLNGYDIYLFLIAWYCKPAIGLLPLLRVRWTLSRDSVTKIACRVLWMSGRHYAMALKIYRINNYINNYSSQLFTEVEVNSTWRITSELANQRARKVLFTCLV